MAHMQKYLGLLLLCVSIVCVPFLSTIRVDIARGQHTHMKQQTAGKPTKSSTERTENPC
jgi:hypothetical protein